MDDELTGLLDQLGAEGAVAALSDEDLAGHEEDLVAAAEAVDPAAATAEDLETLDRLATTVEAVRAERTQRAEAATTRAAEAAERLARIRGPQPADEAEAVAEAEEADEEAAETPAAIPVAAAATPRPAIARLASRQPVAHRPRVAPSANTVRLRSILAGAGAGRLNGQLITREQAAEAIADAASSLPRGAPPRKLHAVTFNTSYPENRTLHPSDTEHNRRILDGVMSPAAITAAGGFCAPAEVDYSVPTIASPARPLRDSGATPAFSAGGRRGRFKFMTSPQLGANTAGISQWTEADDISAIDGDPSKPCDRVDCGTEVDVALEAITKCLTVGNFYDRTYREMVQAVLDIFDADVSRFTEELHLAVMATPVAGRVKAYTSQEVLGTTRTIISVLDRARAAYLDLHRAPDSTSFRVTMNRWARWNVAVDLAREIPGATAERLFTNDSFLGEILARRMINPTWLMDGPSGQKFVDVPSGGTLPGWPTNLVMNFYPEGTWGSLDGGEIDLNVVRSPELNAVNDLQLWSEFFEKTFWRGPTPSWNITAGICPDGSSSAPVDIDPCGSGS